MTMNREKMDEVRSQVDVPVDSVDYIPRYNI